jgi:hypothetical protein
MPKPHAPLFSDVVVFLYETPRYRSHAGVPRGVNRFRRGTLQFVSGKPDRRGFDGGSARAINNYGQIVVTSNNWSFLWTLCRRIHPPEQ